MSKVNTEIDGVIRDLLTDRPVAYHPLLARTVNSVTAGVLLSQFLYWTPRATVAGGWFYKTQAEISDETALSRKEQETARRILRDVGVLEERKRDTPAKLYYRVNMDALDALLRGQSARNGHPSLSADNPTEEPDRADKPARNGQPLRGNTEITTKTTQRSLAPIGDQRGNAGRTRKRDLEGRYAPYVQR